MYRPITKHRNAKAVWIIYLFFLRLVISMHFLYEPYRLRLCMRKCSHIQVVACILCPHDQGHTFRKKSILFELPCQREDMKVRKTEVKMLSGGLVIKSVYNTCQRKYWLMQKWRAGRHKIAETAILWVYSQTPVPFQVGKLVEAVGLEPLPHPGFIHLFLKCGTFMLRVWSTTSIN